MDNHESRSAELSCEHTDNLDITRVVTEALHEVSREFNELRRQRVGHKIATYFHDMLNAIHHAETDQYSQNRFL